MSLPTTHTDILSMLEGSNSAYCLPLKKLKSTVPSGTYLLRPDGNGGQAVVQVVCIEDSSNIDSSELEQTQQGSRSKRRKAARTAAATASQPVASGLHVMVRQMEAPTRKRPMMLRQ